MPVPNATPYKHTGGTEVKRYIALTSSLTGGKWSAWSSGFFTTQIKQKAEWAPHPASIWQFRDKSLPLREIKLQWSTLKKKVNFHQTEPTTVVHLSQVPVCPSDQIFYHGTWCLSVLSVYLFSCRPSGGSTFEVSPRFFRDFLTTDLMYQQPPINASLR